MIRKIGRKIKWSFVDVIHKFGWQPKLNKSKGKVRVLVFHGVCLDNEPYINGRFIHQTKLDRLLTEISTNFHILSINDFIHGNLNQTKLNILCTFDDGYKNNLTIAAPLFEKHNIPFTIFCNNVPYHLMDLIDICQYYQPEILYKLKLHFEINCSIKDLKNFAKNLNKQNIQAYSQFLYHNLSPEILEKSKNFWEILKDVDLTFLSENKLVSFGNHGAYHLNYASISKEEIIEDVNEVTNRFKQISITSRTFAYPFGVYSESSVYIIKSAGYNLLFSDNPSEKHKEMIGRFTINPFISIQNQLIALTKGFY